MDEADKNPARLRRDWLWSLIAEVLARLAAIIVTAAYFTYLGKEAAGQFVVTYSYVMTCWLLVDIGLGLYGARQVALLGAPVKMLQLEITAVRLACSLFASVLVYVLLRQIVGTSVPVALSFGLFLILRGFSLDWLYRGTSRFKTLAVINVVAGIGQLAALPLVTPENWQITLGIPFTVWAAIISSYGWRRSGVSPLGVLRSVNRRSMAHLKRSFSFSVTNGVSTLFQQAPVLALSLMYAPAQLAGFAFMHRLALSSIMLFSSLGAAIYPRLVRQSARGLDQATAATLRATVLIGLVALVPAAGVLLGYAIPYLDITYFPGSNWTATLALAVFLVLRSMRVAPMRLVLAANLHHKAVLTTTTALVVFSGVQAVMMLMGLATIASTALLFVGVEAGVLAWLCLITVRSARSVPPVDGTPPPTGPL